MQFQCNGGPGGRHSQEQDESYSEGEEETSSTSVENSEGEEVDEEEDEEEEESEEESSDTDENDDEETEEKAVTQRRPTRTSGQTQSSLTAKEDVAQKGRLTRQKAKADMPTKRLLRSRKKSPVAGAGSKVTIVFKCPKCKKEFNHKVSLSRHTGWCKQKATKISSPRKKQQNETGNVKNVTPKMKDNTPSSSAHVTPTVANPTSSAPSAPRGRGRPRKNSVPLPLTPSPLSTNKVSKSSSSAKRHQQQSIMQDPQQIIMQHAQQIVMQHPQQIIMQQHFQHEVMVGAGAPAPLASMPMPLSAEEDFMQQKSPESSPGIMDTSSEEDYEQKEFAANAHQLISRRTNSTASIDVVNPDPPGQTDGPVTCPQCKMTYRTFLGYQNHIPNCSPLSSDEEEDEDEVDVVEHRDQVHQLQPQSRPNWTTHQTMAETVIAPPPPSQPPESSEESTSSSDDGGVDADIPVAPSSNVFHQPVVVSSVPIHNSPMKFREISITPSGMGKSPLKIILPPDNTPQVINASGLTLERLDMSPKITAINSPARNGLRTPQKCMTPQSQDESRTITPQPLHVPPPVVYHPPVTSHHPQNNIPTPTTSLPPSQPVYPSSQYPNHPLVQVQNQVYHPPAAPSSASSSKSVVSVASTSSVSTLFNQPVHAGGNPPTYTQAQLMPGTVLHNSIMQIPQQISTSTGEAFHLNQPASQLSQPMSQFPGSHFPLCYTSQAASTPQSSARVQNSVPGLHNVPPGIFVGGTNPQSQQQQLQLSTALAQAQMLRHPIMTEQQRLQTPTQQIPQQFSHQIPSIPGAHQLGQLQGALPVPGQQHPIFANGNSSLTPYGIPNATSQMQQSAFAMSAGTQFQQNNGQQSTNALAFPQMVHQQQQPLQPNGLTAQQIQIPPQQQPNPTGTLPTSVEGTQQFHALQSQLAQYPQYFQNSNLPKMSDNMAQSQQQQQLTQILQQQQTVFNGQQNMATHPVGLPFQTQQLLQQQQRNLSQLQNPHPSLQQQQNAHQSIFQNAITNANSAGQLSGTPTIMQAFSSQGQLSADNGSNSISQGAASLQQQQQGNQAVTIQPEQPSNNLSIQQGQLELNLQQQIQLQQQQQQFIALQQQQQLQIQQNANDPNRPSQQTQFLPQNLQALMMNGSLSLQWANKPGQTQQQQQQIQVQMSHQQQSTTASTDTNPTTNSAQQQQQQPPAAVIQQAPQQQQQQQPQIIQQLAQVTDNAGNTYIIIAPTQPQQQQAIAHNGLTAAAGNNASQLLSLVPGLQGLPSQQQQIQRVNNASSLVQCIANGANHSPGGSSGNSFHSVGRSAPCPCPSCKEKAGTANALVEKYKKVLPHPSTNDPHFNNHHQQQFKAISPNIAPKPPISIRPALPKQPKIVQATPTTRPPLQLTFAQLLQQQNTIPQQQQQQHPGSQIKLIPIQQPVSVSSNPNTVPISNPNIAVVRPMENPLQRLSDQISQIESTFLSHPSTLASTPPPPSPATILAQNQSPRGPHLTLVSASPTSSVSSSPSLPITISSMSPSQQFSHVITLDPPSANGGPTILEIPSESSHPVEMNDTLLNLPTPRLTLVDHGMPSAQPPSSTASSVSSSPQLLSPTPSSSSSIQSISAPSTPVKNVGLKRKVLQVSPSSVGGPAPKNIKLTLQRMGDAYSINKIEGDSARANGSFKSLKIKGRITRSILTSPQEGTSTNVVVVPYIRVLPNPNPDINEGNITIPEDENGPAQENASVPNGGDTNNNNNDNRTLRLTHRVVVMWGVRVEGSSKLLYQSGNVLDVWDRVFEIVQGTRLKCNLPPIFYPSTTIALPQNEVEAQAKLNELELTHKAIRFLLQELPRLKALSQSHQTVKPSPKLPPTPPLLLDLEEEEQEQEKRDGNDAEETDDIGKGSEAGCARFERFTGRKSFDIFGWLTSKHRNPSTECNMPMEPLKLLSQTYGLRYRKLKERGSSDVVIHTSEIHGRGLFTKRDVEKGEMIIEYAGEVIRPLVCDIREKYYQSKAVGCYMFRINDHVIDATMKGNAARFINHSCEPNCEAKEIKISGKDHIIIFSLRQIVRGEELTYDYNFDNEEEKIICNCKAMHCRKYLN